MTTYKSSARSVSDLKAHLVLTTKYRRKAITPAMLVRLTELVHHICQKWGCQVVEFNGEGDHVPYFSRQVLKGLWRRSFG